MKKLNTIFYDIEQVLYQKNGIINYLEKNNCLCFDTEKNKNKNIPKIDKKITFIEKIRQTKKDLKIFIF